MPPGPDPDQARECFGPGVDGGPAMDGGVLGCLAGEICLQGRCYRSCEDDSECGPREMCAASGACVRATHDGGVRDSGPRNPCDGVECTAPQVCHPLSGTCVDCNEATQGAGSTDPGHCSVTAPICDIANGSCVAFAPRECAPCNSDDACIATDGSFTGSCVLRETLGVREHVCFMPCPTDGSACPSGLECTAVTDLATSTEMMVCIPPIEMPCTNWLAGIGGRSCVDDRGCAPLGASRAVYTDSCEGEVVPVEDGGVASPGHCLEPCGTTDDCFNAAGGQQCLGDGSSLFCRGP